jgi:signal transduction histidine kinase
VDQDAPSSRPTTDQLLRELDRQLETAAHALSGDRPGLELARASVDRAREAVVRLLDGQAPGADGPVPLALVRRVELAPAPASSRRARAFTAQTCERWALPAPVRTAAVDVASELVANAAAHGSGPVVLALERGAGNLVVRVWDDGPGSPRVLPYRPGMCEKGLGLRLVRRLSTHWGTAADDGGKWVWARIALPGTDA